MPHVCNTCFSKVAVGQYCAHRHRVADIQYQSKIFKKKVATVRFGYGTLLVHLRFTLEFGCVVWCGLAQFCVVQSAY